jgi:RNA polymerase sigma factor (sigma-70 family)
MRSIQNCVPKDLAPGESAVQAKAKRLISRTLRTLARYGGVMPLKPCKKATRRCLKDRYDEIMAELLGLGYTEDAAADGAGAAYLFGQELLKSDLVCQLSPEHRAGVVWTTSIEVADGHSWQSSPHSRLRFEPPFPVEEDDGGLAEWLAAGVRKQLATLTPRQQLIVEERIYHGRTLAEIGKVLGITTSSVYAQEQAALKRLRIACSDLFQISGR